MSVIVKSVDYGVDVIIEVHLFALRIHSLWLCLRTFWNNGNHLLYSGTDFPSLRLFEQFAKFIPNCKAVNYAIPKMILEKVRKWLKMCKVFLSTWLLALMSYHLAFLFVDYLQRHIYNILSTAFLRQQLSC